MTGLGDHRWYYDELDGGRRGPVAFADLQRLAAAGQLAAGQRVWNPAHPGWVIAEAVPGLFAKEVPPPPAVTAAAGAARPASVWPSDALPLWIVAGIVLCFVLHFSQQRFLGAAAAPVDGELSLAARAAQDDEAFDLEICNHTGAARVYVAIAYFDALRGDWVARGWFAQDKGECHVALKRLTPPVYAYAETRDGSARWGDDAGVPFCLDGEGAFVLPQSRCDQPGARPDRRLEAFKELQLTGSGGVHTWELTP